MVLLTNWSNGTWRRDVIRILDYELEYWTILKQKYRNLRFPYFCLSVIHLQKGRWYNRWIIKKNIDTDCYLLHDPFNRESGEFCTWRENCDSVKKQVQAEISQNYSIEIWKLPAQNVWKDKKLPEKQQKLWRSERWNHSVDSCRTRWDCH